MCLGPSSRRAEVTAEPLEQRACHLDGPASLAGEHQDLQQQLLHVSTLTARGALASHEVAGPLEDRLGSGEGPLPERVLGDRGEQRRRPCGVPGAGGQFRSKLAPLPVERWVGVLHGIERPPAQRLALRRKERPEHRVAGQGVAETEGTATRVE
ncbi:MAG TPA: hypothetical protein VNT52_15485, partial [Acidimicrobiales bacterium]|nr:hypothetical protein [Acidimicrobiales bacterium]